MTGDTTTFRLVDLLHPAGRRLEAALPTKRDGGGILPPPNRDHLRCFLRHLDHSLDDIEGGDRRIFP